MFFKKKRKKWTGFLHGLFSGRPAEQIGIAANTAANRAMR
jgi:hypothetical protein